MRQLGNKQDFGKKLLDLLRNSIWLSATMCLSLLSGFLVSPIIGRYLEPEKFGALNYAISMSGIIGAFAFLGLNPLIQREIAQRRQRREVIISTAFYLTFLGSLFGYLLSLFLLRSNALAALNKNGNLFLLASASFFFQPFFMLGIYFQAVLKNEKISISKIVAAVFYIISRLSLVYKEADVESKEADVESFVVIYVLSIAVDSLCLLYFYSKEAKSLGGKIFVFDRRIFVASKMLLKDSWPYIFVAVGSLIQYRIDIIMVGEMCSENELGQFMVATQTGAMATPFLMIISQVLSPYILRAFKHDREDFFLKLSYSYKIMFLLGFCFVGLFAIFGKFILIPLWGEAYARASFLICIFSLRYVLMAPSQVAQSFYLSFNYQRLSIFFIIIMTATNFLLNLILIPKIQATGALLATVAAMLLANFCSLLIPKTRPNFLCLWKSLFFLFDKDTRSELKSIIKKAKTKAKDKIQKSQKKPGDN